MFKTKLLNIRNGFSARARIYFLIGGSAIIALISPIILKIVVISGRYIPQKALEADYIFGLAWGLVLGLSIFIWPVRAEDKKALLIAWGVKLFVVLGIMLFYEWYYPTDSFGYFNASLHDKLEWPRMEVAGSIFAIVNLIWLQQQVLPPSFHAIKISFAMVGLIAIYIFYRAIVIFLKREKISLFYIFVFFPSIIFWSSTLGKEPISLFGMSLYIYGVVAWYYRRSSFYIIVLTVGILIAMYIRFWYIIILLGPLMVLVFIDEKKKIKKLMFLFLISVFFVLAKRMLMMIFHVQSVQQLINMANRMSYNFDRGGSARGLHTSFSNLGQMLYFLPNGIFTALFRPLPGDVRNPFGLLAGIENLFLLVLLVLALLKMRWRELKNPLVIWAFFLILIWSGIYAFLSFNLGTISRYRLQIIPVLLALLLYQARRWFPSNEPVFLKVWKRFKKNS